MQYTEGDNETLVALVRDFNERPDSDPVRQAQAELAGVKDIMTQNVEQILSRGERIQLLVDRTDNAAHQSQAFRRRAVGIRRQMWWKNAKVLALSGFCGIVRFIPPLSLSLSPALYSLSSPFSPDRFSSSFSTTCSAETLLSSGQPDLT